RRHTRFSRDWSSDVCSSDLSDQSTPCVAPQSTPEVVAMQADSPQATAMARSTRMPTDQLAVWLSLTARMMIPKRELKNRIDSRRSEERRVGKECRARG